MQTPLNDYRSNQVFISNITSMNDLIREYPNQQLISHFIQLKQLYPYYRPIRGDGNCFYRAIAFLYLRSANLNHFSNVFYPIENVCRGFPVQFEGQSFERTLHEIYELNLKPLKESYLFDREEKLAQIFNKSIVFDTMMVIYFRSLNYHYIRRHQSKFGAFIDQWKMIEKIKDFGRDSEGVQFDGIASALNVCIEIQSVDQFGLKAYTYNAHQSEISYDLFLRPGHYDVIYHKNSAYLKESQNRHLTNSYSPIHNNSSGYFKQDPTSLKQSLTPTSYKEKSQIAQNVLQNYNQLPSSQSRTIMTSHSTQKISSKKSNDPFTSLSNLRGNPSTQTNHSIQNPKSSKNKQTPKTQFLQTKPTIRVESYKAWQNETPEQSNPLKKVKQFFILIVFLAGLGFVAFQM